MPTLRAPISLRDFPDRAKIYFFNLKMFHDFTEIHSSFKDVKESQLHFKFFHFKPSKLILNRVGLLVRPAYCILSDERSPHDEEGK